MRALQQAVEVVETAKALQEALAAGKAHVEIRAHLDLTVLDLMDYGILGAVPETVKSIRVRCWFFLPRSRHSQTQPCANIMPAIHQYFQNADDPL